MIAQAETVTAGVTRFEARTPTLPPATTTNSYALGTREVLLVEPATPYEEEQRRWLAWARGLASAGARLVAIFATHHHPDHVGGARALSETLELPLWAHAETASRLSDVGVSRTLVEGEELGLGDQRWHVLHTPGHAPGHLCLFEPTLSILVVGDMVASEGTILIDPLEGDLAAYLAELERLAALGARLALPAHGAPIESPERLFRQYIAHRLMREGKVLEALEEAGSGELDALLPLAYADTPTALWPIARLSLESHLLKLEREGRAERRAGRWHQSRGRTDT